MSKQPDDLSYPVDKTKWGKSIDPFKKENQTEGILNTYIAQVIQFWTDHPIIDIALWEDFRDEFDGWTVDILKLASRNALKAL
jgi:hypothetical protein